jgi:hypothetical protein
MSIRNKKQSNYINKIKIKILIKNIYNNMNIKMNSKVKYLVIWYKKNVNF